MSGTIGDRIRHFRELRGLRQFELAEQARVSNATLSSVESGSRTGEGLSASILRRVARVLGVTVDEIVGERCESETVGAVAP